MYMKKQLFYLQNWSLKVKILTTEKKNEITSLKVKAICYVRNCPLVSMRKAIEIASFNFLREYQRFKRKERKLAAIIKIQSLGNRLIELKNNFVKLRETIHSPGTTLWM